ncbi:chaoptin-like isoform X2 [Rhodnius prolixus]|uniref:chaoptin-like isoform X2 n=1 Tax=Rhodnius prolixus TaxID=13249 RepID=UPI003D188B6C
MLVILAVMVVCCHAIPCTFNPMCSCKEGPPIKPDNITSIRDISCVGVPFSRLPDFPGGTTSHIDVVGSALEVVEADSLASSQLLTVRFISNAITQISDKSFVSASKVLRSLDLSYNRLEQVPYRALAALKTLEWLNLHSNSLTTVDGDWGSAAQSLTNMYLGENHLTDVEGLGVFQRLSLLNLERNQIRTLQNAKLPPSLHTLKLSNNLLNQFPWEFLDSGSRISWLYLRDNFINTIPLYNFKNRKKIDKLDLGENSIGQVSQLLFNGTLQVRDLNLELNKLVSVKGGVFKGTELGRVYLSQNRLKSISEETFAGVENTLEYLDIGGNQLQIVPKALTRLKKLKYLYIPSNNISRIDNETFDNFSSTLSALSLSDNLLESIPYESLAACRKLSHLNLGYNHIMQITEEDFYGLESLDTLLLMNNRIVELPANTFRHTPKLRELSLSFNKISAIDMEAFVDVEESLESLEMSFGLYQEEFPEVYLKPLKSLVWLALDNNNLRSIAQSSLYSFKNLQYLNLDGNRLAHIPAGVFLPSVHRELRDIRISYNHLLSVNPHTFAYLPELQSIVLSGNQIRALKTNAFRSLPSKLSIILSDNKIKTISPRTFNDISTLVRLDLQSNELHDFSLSAFHNVTAPYLPLNLNLSNNLITTLLVADTMRPVCIHTIDLTHNRISTVPKDFFEAIHHTLIKVYLGYNHISKLDEAAFGELASLQALALQHNSIVTLRKRGFAGLGNLQILDISHNHIEQLHMEQFKTLPHLRIIDLSFNHLRSIPRDAFQNTKLERVDLSNNEFVVVPSGALGEVGFTLRLLDMSYNQIEHVDATMFPETPLLTGLNLCYNKLANLADNVFDPLTGLLRLELCGNKLRTNYKTLLNRLSSLRELNLGEVGLRSLPALPQLRHLVTLNLSSNALTDLSSGALMSITNLRTLLVSKCRLAAVPQVWTRLPLLRHLELTYNPLRVLTKSSFRGLDRLEFLDITSLDKLERFDLDALSGLYSLRSLKVQTWPHIFSGGVGMAVSRAPSIRRLSITVSEPTLNRLGPLGTKLRHLEITGPSLRWLDPAALRGIGPSPELTLQIRGTSLEELPLGFLSTLGRVTHLSLDLRNNRLVSLSPDSFYYNLTSWEDTGTKLISGGLMLGGNRWICDCGLVWVGHWLRRWLRESLEIHRAAPEPAVLAAVREAVCTDPKTERIRPLIELYPETLSCHASALSRGGSSAILTPLPIFTAISAFLSSMLYHYLPI